MVMTVFESPPTGKMNESEELSSSQGEADWERKPQKCALVGSKDKRTRDHMIRLTCVDSRTALAIGV